MTPADPPNIGEPGSAAPGNSTLTIGDELHAIARGAVNLVTEATGRVYTMRQFTDDAVTAHIQVIADTYNDGNPIPPAGAPLKKGRPRQVMHGASPGDAPRQ